jgi:hypothetical protein
MKCQQNHTYNAGCRRVLPANNLDEADEGKRVKASSVLSWRRDGAPCEDEEKLFPVTLVPLSEYVPNLGSFGHLNVRYHDYV